MGNAAPSQVSQRSQAYKRQKVHCADYRAIAYSEVEANDRPASRTDDQPRAEAKKAQDEATLAT